MTRTINHIALPVLLLAVVFHQYWVWGLLFMWWAVPSVMTGHTNLVFDIRRDQEPVMFWTVTLLWALFGAMMVAASLFPQYAEWLV